VEAVGDGLAAREVLSKDSDFRIVIADLQMPNETGLELLRKLREQNSTQAIILMSSFISAKQRKIAKELGAHALLDKPFRLSDLLQAVADVAADKAIGISS
jgi:CheY-like chemotaxis protein